MKLCVAPLGLKVVLVCNPGLRSCLAYPGLAWFAPLGLLT